jgi:hypothetical protein
MSVIIKQLEVHYFTFFKEFRQLPRKANYDSVS